MYPADHQGQGRRDQEQHRHHNHALPQHMQNENSNNPRQNIHAANLQQQPPPQGANAMINNHNRNDQDDDVNDPMHHAQRFPFQQSRRIPVREIRFHNDNHIAVDHVHNVNFERDRINFVNDDRDLAVLQYLEERHITGHISNFTIGILRRDLGNNLINSAPTIRAFFRATENNEWSDDLDEDEPGYDLGSDTDSDSDPGDDQGRIGVSNHSGNEILNNDQGDNGNGNGNGNANDDRNGHGKSSRKRTRSTNNSTNSNRDHPHHENLENDDLLINGTCKKVRLLSPDRDQRVTDGVTDVEKYAAQFFDTRSPMEHHDVNVSESSAKKLHRDSRSGSNRGKAGTSKRGNGNGGERDRNNSRHRQKDPYEPLPFRDDKPLLDKAEKHKNKSQQQRRGVDHSRVCTPIPPLDGQKVTQHGNKSQLQQCNRGKAGTSKRGNGNGGERDRNNSRHRQKDPYEPLPFRDEKPLLDKAGKHKNKSQPKQRGVDHSRACTPIPPLDGQKVTQHGNKSQLQQWQRRSNGNNNSGYGDETEVFTQASPAVSQHKKDLHLLKQQRQERSSEVYPPMPPLDRQNVAQDKNSSALQRHEDCYSEAYQKFHPHHHSQDRNNPRHYDDGRDNTMMPYYEYDDYAHSHGTYQSHQLHDYGQIPYPPNPHPDYDSAPYGYDYYGCTHNPPSPPPYYGMAPYEYGDHGNQHYAPYPYPDTQSYARRDDTRYLESSPSMPSTVETSHNLYRSKGEEPESRNRKPRQWIRVEGSEQTSQTSIEPLVKYV